MSVQMPDALLDDWESARRARSENAPRPFALGEAPEPAVWPDVDEEPKVTGLPTHTGTDPYGRAIGPAEDHTKPKLDLDGRTAAEAATEAKEAKKPARRKARQ